MSTLPDYDVKRFRCPCGWRINRADPSTSIEAPIVHIADCEMCRCPDSIAIFLAAVHCDTGGEEFADEKARQTIFDVARRAPEHPRIQRLLKAVQDQAAAPDSVVHRIQTQLMFLTCVKDVGVQIHEVLDRIAPSMHTGTKEGLALWASYITDKCVPRSRPNLEFPDGSNGKLTTFRPHAWTANYTAAEFKVLWYPNFVQVPGAAQATLLRLLCEYLKKLCKLEEVKLFLSNKAHTFHKCTFGSTGSMQVRLTTMERADIDKSLQVFFQQVHDVANLAGRVRTSFDRLVSAQFLPSLRADFIKLVSQFEERLSALYSRPSLEDDDIRASPAAVGFDALAPLNALATALKDDASYEELIRISFSPALSRLSSDNMQQRSLIFVPQLDSLMDLSVSLAGPTCKQRIDLGSSCLPLAGTVAGDFEQGRREEVGRMWKEATTLAYDKLWEEAKAAAAKQKAAHEAQALKQAEVAISDELKLTSAQSARMNMGGLAMHMMHSNAESKQRIDELKARLFASMQIKARVAYVHSISKNSFQGRVKKWFLLTEYIDTDRRLKAYVKARADSGAMFVPVEKRDVDAFEGLQARQLELAEEIGRRMQLHKEKGKYDCELVLQVCRRYSMMTRNIVTLHLPLDGKVIKRTRKVAASEASSKQLKDVSKQQFSVTLCAGYSRFPRYIFRLPFCAFGPRAQQGGLVRMLQYTIDTLNALVVVE